MKARHLCVILVGLLGVEVGRLSLVPANEQLLERATLVLGSMLSSVALLLRSMMSVSVALVLGLEQLVRAVSRSSLVLVEADRVEVSPAIELLRVHPPSFLGVATLVLLVLRPLPKASALGGCVLCVGTMVRAPAGRGSVDANGLC